MRLLRGGSDVKLTASAAAPRLAATESVLGLFYEGVGGAAEGEVVFGARIATQGFTAALLQHGRMDRCELFAPPDRVGSAAAQVGQRLAAARADGGSVRVHDCRRLAERFDAYRFTAWHEPAALFPRVFHLRGTYSRTLFPITFTHHTISNPFLLHTAFLPLLLADSHSCDAVVCTSRAARAAFAHLLAHVGEEFGRAFGVAREYRGRLEVIPLGVDPQLFQPRDRADLRHQLGLPQDALILLSLSRFSVSDKMDLLPLLRVFQHLVRDNPHRKLLLVLAGTEPGGYASVVDRYAISLGLQPHVRIIRGRPIQNPHLLLAAADVFVSPSDNIQECFGLTPIEAMACGVPQVVSDWNGYRDTVAHGETGFRVPTYWTRCDGDLGAAAALEPTGRFDHLALAQSVVVDPAAMRDHLQRLVENQDLREAMGRRSRERALSLYAWPAVISQYEALWRDLAEVAGGQPLPPAPNTRYNQPPYFEAFAHYATASLPEEARLRLTATGLQLLQAKEELPVLGEVSECLDRELLRRALTALQVSGRLSRGYPLGELAADLANERACPPDAARRHVMWLMKYGFAEPAGGLASLAPEIATASTEPTVMPNGR